MALVLAAAALAVAAGVVVFALEAPVEDPAQPGHRPQQPATERRAARPEARSQRAEAPLVRLSRIHVAVRAEGAVDTDSGALREHEALVLLDTGISLPIATPDGRRLFALSPGAGDAVQSRGISGVPVELFPTEDGRALHLALVGQDNPARVDTTVRYLGVDRLFGAHVILAPHLLGPAGGAVRLDLGAARFAACETAAACLDGSGWVRISDTPCPSRPELVVVRATVAGATARLLLDTGGATLVSRRFFESGALGAFARESPTDPGRRELIGSGGAEIPGVRVDGAWPVSLGEVGVAKVTATALWVADAPAGPIAECGLEGALGIDTLTGCALVIADGAPLAAFVRCPEPPRSRPG